MKLTQITPIVPWTSLERQIEFYRDVLGFVVGFQTENYAYLKRDDAALRLVEVSLSVDLTNPERQGSFYIDVVEINALYASLKPALDELPVRRVRAPFNQDYDQREFHVADEDCTVVFFGEALTTS